MKKILPIFYWSEVKFIFKEKENYGDLLSKYLIEKISGKPIKWVHPKKLSWYHLNKTHFLAIGSILHHATKYSIVWGSGIIDKEHDVEAANFRAVRGPQTRKFLLERGLSCPEVYGDPALLLPKYYNPMVEKRFSIGIIPHYNDFEIVSNMYINDPDILVIDLMTLDIEEVTSKILQCEHTISSSLHGVIVSHAYNIPSIWVEFSDKIFGDGIKYRDYLESVAIPFYKGPLLKKEMTLQELQGLFTSYPSLPESGKILEVCKSLEKACPF